jgi:pyridoxamine 5'-phosphate oxidase
VTEWSDVTSSDPAGPPEVVPGALDLSALRRSYEADALDERTVADTWLEQFTRWFTAAQEDDAITEANAMQLATADPDGHASVRTVLAKGVSARGVVFYSNYDSPKGTELARTQWAAVVFAWLAQQRQVRISGPTAPVDRAETERYFAQRPRGSQLGAWASAQSSVVAGRAELDAAEAEMARRFGEDRPIPPPPNWGGYLLQPLTVEFWQGRTNRMHDRLRFRRDDVRSSQWQLDRLAP